MDTQSAIIVDNFYASFQRKDTKTMTQLYHPEAKFSDPAFGELDQKEVISMWKMLCSSSDDLAIEYKILYAKHGLVKTQWHAYYSFGKARRNVHNTIHSEMEIKDGKIYRHNDDFNLHNWAKQAIGLMGNLLGNTSYFQRKLNKKTKYRLASYIKKNQ